MKITVIGTGYVGLVTAVCLANTGKTVYCIDKDINKLNKIKRGITPIFEPGLENLMKKNIERIFPTEDLKEAVINSEVIIITVGTPFDGENIDLRYVKQTAKEIGKHLKGQNLNTYKVITIKSTVVPGTTLNVVKPIIINKSNKNDREIGFCMNPEFLREGHAVDDFTHPDRIVLGVTSKEAENTMRNVYGNFKDTDIMVTNPTTAEMIKYTANSFLALTISYANEIANICETCKNIDSEDVFRGVILDKRISPIIDGKRTIPQISTYLKAGCGFGGSCFPKDVKTLASFEKEKGLKGGLLDTLLDINERQIKHIFELGLKNFKGKPKNISILGTSFKPDTDDIRESPGIKLAKMALSKKFNVYVHDYAAIKNTKKVFKDKLNYCKHPIEAIKNADIVYLVTIWDKYAEISEMDFETHLNKKAILVDCRSFYKNRDPKPWRIRVGVGNTGKDQSR